MSQYSDGLIIIYTKQEKTVYGIGTLFVGNVSTGDIFIIDGEGSSAYIIERVVSDTEITLSTPYLGLYRDIRIEYSISRDFSSKFDFPVIGYNQKSFSTISSLSLRMIDSVFKNLAFINPLDPRCVSSNSLRVKIYPQQAIDAQARWQLDNLPDLFKSGITYKNLSVGTHTVSFTEIPSFISPINISTIMEPNSNRIIVGRYTLL